MDWHDSPRNAAAIDNLFRIWETNLIGNMTIRTDYQVKHYLVGPPRIGEGTVEVLEPQDPASVHALPAMEVVE